MLCNTNICCATQQVRSFLVVVASDIRSGECTSPLWTSSLYAAAGATRRSGCRSRCPSLEAHSPNHSSTDRRSGKFLQVLNRKHAEKSFATVDKHLRRSAVSMQAYCLYGKQQQLNKWHLTHCTARKLSRGPHRTNNQRSPSRRPRATVFASDSCR